MYKGRGCIDSFGRGNIRHSHDSLHARLLRLLSCGSRSDVPPTINMFRLAACCWDSPPAEAEDVDEPMEDNAVFDALLPPLLLLLLLPPVSEGSSAQLLPPRPPPRGESGRTGAAPR